LDRNKNTSSCFRGGGTLIAVNNSLNPSLLNVSILLLEQLFVLLCFKNQIFIISPVSILPNIDKSNYVLYINSVDEILHNYSSSNINMIGNFNFPHILCSRDPQEKKIITPLYVANSTES